MLNKSTKKYLQHIIASNKILHSNCNAGATMSEEKGDYRNIYTWVM